jgi:hypothetical protein
MKVPLEILIVLTLVYLGWGQSFKQQFHRISGHPEAAREEHAQMRARISPSGPSMVARPTPDNSWMFGPTALDRPPH